MLSGDIIRGKRGVWNTGLKQELKLAGDGRRAEEIPSKESDLTDHWVISLIFS